MTSLTSIRRRPEDVASLVSRAAKYAFAGECTTSTRHFGSSCLARPNYLRIDHFTRTTPLRSLPTQRFPSLSTGRFNSGKSKTPTFRQWGFEDINAHLPSSSPSSPPSTPDKARIILIDVREPAELSSTGIIPSAIAVPLASQPDALFLTPDEFETRFGYPKPGVEGADQEAELVFYCKAGVRARAAAQLAVQAGYEEGRIGVYDGSWLDWAGKRGRVERWEGDD
ncbi:Rhodanese-like domain-containing protein [Aspergillus cavernicola]|uniref:Rhodanese-like domain-containing protein n=1 Tax=Aspergillus cavernicola TaxID=176166 RepID=A0ABR4IHV3_9EURO